MVAVGLGISVGSNTVAVAVADGVGVGVGLAIDIAEKVGGWNNVGRGTGVTIIGNWNVGEGKTYTMPGWGIALGGAATLILNSPNANAPINPTMPTNTTRKKHPITRHGNLRDLGNWAGR